MLSGMLKELVDDKLSLTIRGREISSDFSFELSNQNNKKVTHDVSGVQIEVDGGYESTDAILLIEAKMNFQNNMNIRQLLYPQLNYEAKYNKEIISYVMFYEIGGRFHFLPFSYKDNQCTFDFDNYKLFQLNQDIKNSTSNDLFKIKINKDMTDRNAPFPQADDFSKVYSIFLKIGEKHIITKSDLFEDYNLTSRQHDYYLNVLIWMRLAIYDSQHKIAFLSDKGIKFYAMNEQDRFLEMAQIVFSNPIFNMILHDKKEKITDQMIKENNMNPQSSTFERRQKAVSPWFNFFKEKLDAFQG